MKVWMLGREYPEKYNNFRGSFELEQAQLMAKDHEVYYPATDLRSIRRWRPWGVHAFCDQNVQVMKLNFPIGRFPRWVMEPLRFDFMKKVLRHLEKKTGLPQIIHVHYPSMTDHRLIAPFEKKGVKIVATEHYTKVLTRDITAKELENLNWFSEHSSAFICVGKQLAESTSALTGNQNILVVPNVCNSLFSSVKAEAHEGFVFVAVGRLEKVKQFDMLIEAFHAAFYGQDNIRLVIIGGGSEHANLVQMIESLDLKKQVVLIGALQREAVAEYMENADALVCSSRLETFGVPVIEAMACGKPVVTSNAIGFTELIDERIGIVFPNESKDELRRALREIYQKYHSFDSDYIASCAKEHFSEDVIRCKLQAIYETASRGAL